MKRIGWYFVSLKKLRGIPISLFLQAKNDDKIMCKPRDGQVWVYHVSFSVRKSDDLGLGI